MPNNEIRRLTSTNELAEMCAASIRAGESYEMKLIRGAGLAGGSTEAVEFESCRFVSADLSKTNWDRPRLLDVRIDSCDLAVARGTSALLEKTQFIKCRGTGWQFLDANCSDTMFTGGKFNLAAFHGSKFRRCLWEKCDLREANFEDVELVDVVFRKCDLRAARFPSVVLESVDFRGSQLAGLQIDAIALRGCRVEASQLPDLIELFGLIVEPVIDD